jgi:hypothetical protein
VNFEQVFYAPVIYLIILLNDNLSVLLNPPPTSKYNLKNLRFLLWIFPAWYRPRSARWLSIVDSDLYNRRYFSPQNPTKNNSLINSTLLESMRGWVSDPYTRRLLQNVRNGTVLAY